MNTVNIDDTNYYYVSDIMIKYPNLSNKNNNERLFAKDNKNHP